MDWWREIEKGIEEADVFLFLISPDSAKSKVCRQEIEVAVKNGKRIIPIVVRDIAWEDTPPHLGQLNYIFIRESDDFDAAVKKLMTAIQTDYEWVATHRRLQVKALDWERNSKDNGFLLRGRDLLDAEQDLVTNTSKEPHPTDLQREYAFANRKATDRQRRTTTSIAIGVVVVLTVLAVVAIVMAVRATKQARISRAGELAAQSVSQRENQFDLSLLLSVEAYRVADTIQSRSALLDNTQAYHQLRQILRVDTGGIFSLNFSPNNKILTSVSCSMEYWGLTCPTSEIIQWDMDTHQSISQPLTGYVGEITSVAINSDGKTLAFATSDNTIILWDMTTRRHITQPLTGFSDTIFSLSFSPDGKTIASASDSVILWDVDSGQRIGQPIKVDFIPYSIAFSSDGKILAIGGIDMLILWDISDGHRFGKPLKEFSDNILDSCVLTKDSKISGKSKSLLLDK